ncbi:MAG: carboxy terminal-processing peptidase [Bacteroidales bacterium]|nr:carboxy terminal-processing peptidase [Bacteroidales bacterium]
MRIKKIMYFFSLLFWAISILSSAQVPIADKASQKIFDNQKDKLLSSVILATLESAHYHPREINDSLSVDFFGEYLKNIDRTKKFLLQEDVDLLNQYRLDLDDQLLSDRLDFFNLSNEIIEKRNVQVQQIYRELLQKPFDYTVHEQIQLNTDKLPYSKTLAELKDSWRQALKFQVIAQVYDALKSQEKAASKSDTVTIKSFDTLEKEARASILKRNDEWFHRIIDQTNNTDKISVYMNSLTAVFDPHTSYFPPKLKEDFDIRFSGTVEGIGATLSSKDGYVRVVDIVPGSPSWKQGDLKADDIIMKVAQGKKEPVDLYDMRLDDAVDLIRGPKGTEVRLTIRKPDGRVLVVPIIRDKVIREETYAKSAVLQGKTENSPQIAYIYLPSFYSDFNDPAGRRSSVDMKKEIEKINKEGIKDIVLDMRNNGGGSLMDAVDIAGLFIKNGPVVQVKDGSGNVQVLSDQDVETYYNGNLVILVNSFSASATEILAAAMQDYHRAVIVGTKSTYGKGTVQRFTDLDRMLPARFNQFKELGSLKYTMQKFYRVNGGATQKKGVVPEIVLPDIYSYIDFGEKEEKWAMPWDEISPANYTPTYNYIPDYTYLEKKSKERVASSTQFSLIDERAKLAKVENEETLDPLNFADYTKMEDASAKGLKKYEELGKENLPILVRNLKDDDSYFESDSTRSAINKEWHKDLSKDIYIYEAMHVIEDLEASRK